MTILSKLKQFIEQQQMVSEKTLANKFDISQGSIEAMLMIFIKKNIIRKEINNGQNYYCWGQNNCNSFSITQNLVSNIDNNANSNSCKGCKYGCKK